MTGKPDWQNDMRKAFEGFNEAFAKSIALVEAQKRREGEDGYLPHHVAWECARVEYVWRQEHAVARKRCEEWYGLYKVVKANGGYRRDDCEQEKAAYKARWEERGRKLFRAWETAHVMAESLDEARRDLESARSENAELTATVGSLRGELEEARDSAERQRTRAERIRAANLRLCAMKDAERPESVPGVLVIRRKGSDVWDVVRPGGTDIGYLRPSSAGWNAYVVYTTPGAEKFVGWYEDSDTAATAVERGHGR